MDKTQGMTAQLIFTFGKCVLVVDIAHNCVDFVHLVTHDAVHFLNGNTSDRFGLVCEKLVPFDVILYFSLPLLSFQSCIFHSFFDSVDFFFLFTNSFVTFKFLLFRKETFLLCVFVCVCMRVGVY